MTLPKRTHLVHKPIEFRNLSKSVQEATDIRDPEQYTWEYKYDGCHVIIRVDDGHAEAFSRQGEKVRSIDHVLEHMAKMPDGVYFAEAYSFRHTHSEINGMFRKQSVQEDLKVVLFDYVGLKAFDKGSSVVPYRGRRQLLNHYYVEHCLEDEVANQFILIAARFRPDRLDNTLKLIEGIRHSGVRLELDGFVAKRLDGLWIAGAGKGGEQIKVKDTVSLDLRVVEVVEGQGKFSGAVGALVVEDAEGERFTVSGGKLTLPQRVNYFRNPEQIVGYIIEVHALGISQHGDLREARFHRFRSDKSEPDKV